MPYHGPKMLHPKRTFCMRSAAACAPRSCCPDMLLCMEKGARFTGAAGAFCSCSACSAMLRGSDPIAALCGLCTRCHSALRREIPSSYLETIA